MRHPTKEQRAKRDRKRARKKQVITEQRQTLLNNRKFRMSHPLNHVKPAAAPVPIVSARPEPAMAVNEQAYQAAEIVRLLAKFKK